MYFSLDQAKEEVQQRWSDPLLKKEIERFVGEVPEPLKGEPRAWLGRYIVTPDNEFFHFLNLAEQCNLKPLAIETLEDRFYRKNDDKLALGHMTFLDKKSSDITGKDLKEYKVLDVKKNHMKPFNEIETLWGEGFARFHHRLLSLYAPPVEIYDASAWFRTRGPKAEKYYPYFLALFVSYGVLFENFVTEGYEMKFTEEIVHTAIEEVTRLFGLAPLIVPLIPEEEVMKKYWWCFPECIEQEVDRCVLEGRTNGNRIKNKQPQ